MAKKLETQEKLKRFWETQAENFKMLSDELQKLKEELMLENGVETRRVAKEGFGDKGE